jgi:hypothetical protein
MRDVERWQAEIAWLEDLQLEIEMDRHSPRSG